MASTVIDSKVFGPLFGNDRMREIFSDENLVQKWLDTEAALAFAQAELGIIPRDMASEIVNNAKAGLLNLDEIGENFKSSITIVPLLKVFKKAFADEAGEYVHWGATSQDIVDTGLILQIREAHAEIVEKLRLIHKITLDLAKKHRDLVMAGRTHVIHALPITLGFKIAIWASEIGRHLDRLEECKKRLFVGQFSGAVGTLASQEEKGLTVQKLMMEKLGLGVPEIAWHTARDHIAEFVGILALIAGTIGKITHEVLTLQRTETAEMEEPFFMGKVGSSTMPHKRNPQVCENVIALTRNIRSIAPVAVEAMNCENERDWSCEIAEWDFVPRACILTGTALEKTIDILENLIVYPENMEANLNKLKGLMLSESVMMKLAEKMGRLHAHKTVYEICMNAFEHHTSMRDALLANGKVMQYFTAEEIDRILDPHKYTGLAATFVDRVLEKEAGR